MSGNVLFCHLLLYDKPYNNCKVNASFKIIFVLQSLFDFIQLLFRNFRHLQNLFF